MEKGYNVHEVAALLGVSVKTVRKRIIAGDLRADKVNGPRGPQYVVWLDEDTLESRQGREPVDNSVSTPAVQATLDPRLESLLALPADVGEIKATLAGHHGSLESLNRLSEDQRKALADYHQTVLHWKEQADATIAALRAELEQARRPLWKRWFRRP